MKEKISTKLFYFGTDVEVLLGDRICLKTLFMRRKKFGTVSCIPEHSGKALFAEGKQPEDWLLTMDDGTITGWLYCPEELQPPKRLSFIKRGDTSYKGITNQDLEELETKEEQNVSWKERAWMIVFLLIFLGIIVAAGYLWKN